MERTAVVDENVILYLDGGERIDGMEEICHDDHIAVAFTGSCTWLCTYRLYMCDCDVM